MESSTPKASVALPHDWQRRMSIEGLCYIAKNPSPRDVLSSITAGREIIRRNEPRCVFFVIIGYRLFLIFSSEKPEEYTETAKDFLGLAEQAADFIISTGGSGICFWDMFHIMESIPSRRDKIWEIIRDQPLNKEQLGKLVYGFAPFKIKCGKEVPNDRFFPDPDKSSEKNTEKDSDEQSDCINVSLEAGIKIMKMDPDSSDLGMLGTFVPELREEIHSIQTGQKKGFLSKTLEKIKREKRLKKKLLFKGSG